MQQRSESTTRPVEVELFQEAEELWIRRNIEEEERELEDGTGYTVFVYDEVCMHTRDSLEIIEAHLDTFWAMGQEEYAYVCVADYLRYRRQVECFAVVDRPLWLDSLTDEELEEIKTWRAEWLAVTDTLEIPEAPVWL